MRDEWLTRYGSRAHIPPDLLSKRIVDFWRSQGAIGSDISLLLGPSLDHDTDDSLSHLELFVADSDSRSENSVSRNTSELTQAYLPSPVVGEEVAWIDHRVWLDNVTFSLTIPQQPDKLLNVPELQEALRTQGPRSAISERPDLTYRRLLYIADAESSAVRALIKEATFGMEDSLSSLFRGYFSTNPSSKCHVLRSFRNPRLVIPTFQFTFFALSRNDKRDERKLNNQTLRLAIPLSFLSSLKAHEEVAKEDKRIMCQAVTSFAITVCDRRLWDGICLNDEYFMKYSRLSHPEDSMDPIMREEWHQNNHLFDGLCPVRVNSTDPIIDQESSCTHSDPRTYSLQFLECTLRTIGDYAQELYEEFEGPIIAQRNYFLSCSWNTTGPANNKPSPDAQSAEAVRLAKTALRTLSHSITQQVAAVDSFLEEDLLLDKRSMIFRSPLFVSLNSELYTHSRHKYVPNILQMQGRLRKISGMTITLQHYCEDIEIEASQAHVSICVFLQLSDQIQHARISKAEHDAEKEQARRRALGVTISHFVATAMTVALALYSVPLEVTRLPASVSGFVGVCILVILLLVVPAVLLIFPGLAERLQRCALIMTRRWTS
ncbi:hypothetical protein LIA77_05955 [Sarocladium implicatum]|nr:hypothetical protein LIA77_05955 [Sarocladium implicatum]